MADEVNLHAIVQQLESLTQQVRQLIAQELTTATRVDHTIDGWPMAVLPSMIVRPTDEAGQLRRGQQIAAWALSNCGPAPGAVLDFGCGHGHIALALAASVPQVVGYDHLLSVPAQPVPTNLILTQSWRQVRAAGPYDLVLLYDVFDHLDNPIAQLQQVAELVRPGGHLLLRCHPWTARTGGHLYELPQPEMNRAYLHLTMTSEQLRQLLVVVPPRPTIRPLALYDRIDQHTRLRVRHRQVDQVEPEDYFSGELLDKIVQHTWAPAIDHDTARKIMRIQYVDYLLQRPG